MTTKSESKLYDIASKMVKHSWNRTNANAKIALILSIIESREGTVGLQKFLQNAKEKANDYTWSNYYGALEPLVNEFLSSGYDEHIRYDVMLSALHAESKDFNWHNATMLIRERLLNNIADFDNDFRGNIVHVHRVGKHDIVETETKDENSVKCYCYYPLCHVSRQFNKLEHALLYSILGDSFSRSAIVLEQAYSDGLTNKH
jgi:hypothetical protein